MSRLIPQIKEAKMKIKITALILALLLFSLASVSCKKNTDENYKPESFEFTARKSTEESASENGYVYVLHDVRFNCKNPSKRNRHAQQYRVRNDKYTFA